MAFFYPHLVPAFPFETEVLSPMYGHKRRQNDPPKEDTDPMVIDPPFAPTQYRRNHPETGELELTSDEQIMRERAAVEAANAEAAAAARAAEQPRQATPVPDQQSLFNMGLEASAEESDPEDDEPQLETPSPDQMEIDSADGSTDPSP